MTKEKHAGEPARGTKTVKPEDSSFSDLGLSHKAVSAVERAGFESPSEIQREFIPAALTGRDCIGRARTGTGKTAAFLLPIFERVYAGESEHALILAPTRELAKQICAESDTLSGKYPPTAVPVYGGQPMKQQIQRLKNNPEIVVATPGRVIDHGKRGTIAFHRFHTIVLDEVDRMFDMGFRKDIRYILDRCTNRRQTLFLSATLPDSIMRLAERYTSDPVRINALDEGKPAVALLEQRYFAISEEQKLPLLLALLEREDPTLALVFTRTKHGADRLAGKLTQKGLNVCQMHGDMPQNKREAALAAFRDRKVQILVATDVVGRGIDVAGVSHVINFDIPQNPEDYLHRTGRSARMNTEGMAITFVTPEEGKDLTAIEMLCNTLIEKDEIEGVDTGIRKRDRKKRR